MRRRDRDFRGNTCSVGSGWPGAPVTVAVEFPVGEPTGSPADGDDRGRL